MAQWHYVCRRRTPLFSNSLHSLPLPFLSAQPSSLLRPLPVAILPLGSPSLVCRSRPRGSAICNRQFGGACSPRLPFFFFYCLSELSRTSITREHYCEHASSWFNPHKNRKVELLMSRFYCYVCFNFTFFVSCARYNFIFFFIRDNSNFNLKKVEFKLTEKYEGFLTDFSNYLKKENNFFAQKELKTKNIYI